MTEEEAWDVAVKNRGLVIHMIKTRFGWMNNLGATDIEDYIQAGMIGLYRAAKKYDPKRSKFSVYAYPWIYQSISLNFRNEGFKAVRVPSFMFDKMSKINKKHSKDIDTYMKNQANHTMRSAFYALSDPIHLNTKKEDHEEEMPVLKNDMSDYFSRIDDAEKKTVLIKALSRLKGNQKKVIDFLFGLNGEKQLDVGKISKKLKISEKTVQNIRCLALNKMRKIMGDL